MLFLRGFSARVSAASRRTALTLIALTLIAGSLQLAAQNAEPLPQALEQMIETERAFAARALVVGWKQAFLEYFANDAVGFAEGAAGLAKEQIAKRPDPPKDVRLIWEPRLGDVAASGELGYLTGPVRTIVPSRNKGQPTHSNYFSVWKRQRDGSFKVIMDVGVDTPSAVQYPPGFTRPSYATRFTGDYDETTPPLGAADGVLNSALRTSQAQAFRARLAAGARLFRPNTLPIVGDRNIARWAANQPAYALSDTRYSEAARSGDLGYTWGTYALPTAKGRQEGFYIRVWARERSGQWKLAADILQPQLGK